MKRFVSWVLRLHIEAVALNAIDLNFLFSLAPARFVPGTRQLIVRCCLRTCYPFPLCFSMFNRGHLSSIVSMLVVENTWKMSGSFTGFAVNPNCSPLGLAHGVNGQNRRGPYVHFHGSPSRATLKHHFILEDFWWNAAVVSPIQGPWLSEKKDPKDRADVFARRWPLPLPQNGDLSGLLCFLIFITWCLVCLVSPPKCSIVHWFSCSLVIIYHYILYLLSFICRALYLFNRSP